MSRLTGSSAVLLVSDLQRAAEYYRDRLGFTCEMYGEPPDFLVAERDDAVILMYDAPSGFREFGVQDPDGHEIAIGQPIGEQA